jgi:hypothetical protein
MHAGSVARDAVHRVGSFGRSFVGLLPYFRDRHEPGDALRIASRADTRHDLDALAHREFNMTGPEFVIALRAGRLPKSPAVDHLALLADVADPS